MKENILFLMYVIRGNFDHAGGGGGGDFVSRLGGTSSKQKENTRNERKRLRKPSKVVGSPVFVFVF